jgi:DNA polymerase/3'-5' exonuclease PolX
MYKVEVTETCLKTGYNARLDYIALDKTDVDRYLKDLCDSAGIDPKKLESKYKSLKKGTVEGIKLFYNPEPGRRNYLWITVYEEKRLS